MLPASLAGEAALQPRQQHRRHCPPAAPLAPTCSTWMTTSSPRSFGHSSRAVSGARVGEHPCSWSTHLATKSFIVGVMLQSSCNSERAHRSCNSYARKGGNLSSASNVHLEVRVHHGLDFSLFRMDRGLGRPGRPCPDTGPGPCWGTTPLNAARSSRRTVQQPVAAYNTIRLP